MPPRKRTSPAKRPAAASLQSSPNDAVPSALASLKRLGSARVRDEMGPRYGIHLPDPKMAFGVGMAALQKLAKSLKTGDAARHHALAAALWETGYYEARMLAGLIDEPSLVTPAQMDRWAADFDNWGICDTVCFKLFDRVPSSLAFEKIHRWSRRPEEFRKRAAFALLACVALHDKSAPDQPFAEALTLIESASTDDRNFVKKGVNWALRAIGTRGPDLKAAAAALARRLADSPSPAARWIGKDALKSLTPSKPKRAAK